MITVLSRLASIRLTLVGMVALAIGAGLSYDNPAETSVWVLAAPLALLSLNLFAAILTNPRINRRPGLFVFHVGLLLICVFAAIGRLTLFEGRVEMSQGAVFDVQSVADVKQGPWHNGRLDEVVFVQGPWTVSYQPGLKRGPTRSHVSVPDGRGGWREKVVGDDKPLIIDGYRFYTTFNKGFAVIVSWIPIDGEAMTGTIHMPSYPLFDYKQDNRWTTPGGNELKLWLRVETGLNRDKAWVLDGSKATGVLVVNSGNERVELGEGESMELPGGRLRFEQLSTWMGYKIFYDPTLRWLFISAIVAVFGLAYHYWRKMAQQPWVPGDHRGEKESRS